MNQSHQEHQASVAMMAAIRSGDYAAIAAASQQREDVKNGR